MRSAIKQKLDEVGARPVSLPTMRPHPRVNAQTAPVQVPHLVTKFHQECLADINAGKVLSLKTISERLAISLRMAHKTFTKKPGVFRIGTTYRVPQCVFESYVRETLQ
jgi:hypothetical protein